MTKINELINKWKDKAKQYDKDTEIEPMDLYQEILKDLKELKEEDIYLTKLMFTLSPTTHEIDLKTTNKFKEIIKENIEEDTYTIKQKLKEYWNNRNDNNLFNQDLLNEAIYEILGEVSNE